jgi:hypothetical protein
MQFVYNFLSIFIFLFLTVFKRHDLGHMPTPSIGFSKVQFLFLTLISFFFLEMLSALIGVVALRIKIHYLVICYHVTPVDVAIKVHVPLQHTPIPPLQF